jgi:2-polyprenyl-6-methoxyphenol hydroxylase-like FAD-dependent oxidoreductase
MLNRRILISGLGIAGPALAWWLQQAGFAPEIVEQAPAPRRGGYLIDFWGLGWTVAGRMGLLPAIRQAGYLVDEVRLVNARGRRLASLDAALFRRAAGNQFTTLPRSQLADILYRSLSDRVPVHLADRITSLQQDDDGVTVGFARTAARRFDLVIGADGLHSQVRALAFGPEPTFERDLGCRIAIWSAADYPHKTPNIYVSYTVPGGQLARFDLRDGATTFFCVFRGAGAADPVPAFTGRGWECDEILATLSGAADLYTDSVSQIRMPVWHQGRIALIGDAAWCPSLLAGQGAAMAMLGAYVLAGELFASGGDPRPAFAAYQRRLQALIAAKQKAALGYAGWFAPRGRLGVAMRVWTTRMFSVPLIIPWLTRRMLVDPLDLPDYFSGLTT